MTDVEAALDELEMSWADFAYAIRPDSKGRISRRHDLGSELGVLSLVKVHEILENYQNEFVAGNRFASFLALIYCAEENVPMPYWLANAVLNIASVLYAKPDSCIKPKNLHELFGAEQTFPTSQTRALKAKRDLHLRGQLWHTTRCLMHEKKLSVEAAIKEARKQLRFPYSQRKSRDLFDEQEKTQTTRLNIMSGRKVHRIK